MLSIETTPPVISDPGPCPEEGQEALLFSPNGQALALASEKRGISFWDPTTGESRGIIALPLAPSAGFTFVTMDFSPDGRLLAYAFSNEDVSLIVLWDVALQAVRSVTKGNQAMHRAKI